MAVSVCTGSVVGEGTGVLVSDGGAGVAVSVVTGGAGVAVSVVTGGAGVVVDVSVVGVAVATGTSVSLAVPCDAWMVTSKAAASGAIDTIVGVGVGAGGSVIVGCSRPITIVLPSESTVDCTLGDEVGTAPD